MLVFVLVTQSWPVYFDSTLSFIGLTKIDIAFRNDYTLHDPYRFAIVDRLLNDPLGSADYIMSLEEILWERSQPAFFNTLVGLYGIEAKWEKDNFIQSLSECSRLLEEAFCNTPVELCNILEDLILFSPELTSSIEEDKEGEKRGDSLVAFLKDNGTKVDYTKLFTAGLRILSAIESYDEWLGNIDRKIEEIDSVKGNVLYYKTYDFGGVVVGDTGDNIYTKDFALIIDLGGNDIYQCSTQTGRLHIIIDKEGNDLYTGSDYSVACGRFGVSILLDEEGDDTYEAQSFSIGCGIFGLGFLADHNGHDRYRGDTFTQGTGGFGIGVLWDGAGNDMYEGALYTQGVASTYGIGILGDRHGNDVFVAIAKYTDEIRYLDHYLSFSQGFSIGFRPDLSAGIGIIFEGDGNDCYIGDIFAQASAYWYGLGAIVDGKGNDNYVAYQYAQGEGTHIAIGVLIDREGDDNYVAKGVSQGCGHDLSLGLLYDIRGDDSYVAFDLSQGAGNANGVGILIDEFGNDSYTVKRTRNTQGYGDFRREYSSIGILLDIKGDDVYRTGGNNTLWKNGECGVGIDWE